MKTGNGMIIVVTVLCMATVRPSVVAMSPPSDVKRSSLHQMCNWIISNDAECLRWNLTRRVCAAEALYHGLYRFPGDKHKAIQVMESLLGSRDTEKPCTSQPGDEDAALRATFLRRITHSLRVDNAPEERDLAKADPTNGIAWMCDAEVQVEKGDFRGALECVLKALSCERFTLYDQEFRRNIASLCEVAGVDRDGLISELGHLQVPWCEMAFFVRQVMLLSFAKEINNIVYPPVVKSFPSGCARYYLLCVTVSQPFGMRYDLLTIYRKTEEAERGDPTEKAREYVKGLRAEAYEEVLKCVAEPGGGLLDRWREWRRSLESRLGEDGEPTVRRIKGLYEEGFGADRKEPLRRPDGPVGG